MKRALLTLALALCLLPSVAQKITIQHLEPANWWTGMKNPDVQLLVHGPGIGAATVTLAYPGVTLKEVAKVESPNYLFITLSIAPDAPAGRVPLVFRRGKARLTHPYELRPRSADTTRIRGFSAADLIYLIMPDRFANGDPQNDVVAGMKEGAVRGNPLGRHGGDLKGIADRLDYVKEMGATALWLNPVQENNQENASYHGYAITDFYKIDPRFGTNEAYKSLVEGSHAEGMKVIMDLVHNHCGSGHWWMQDLPVRDWIHQPDSAWPSYRSNFRSSVISDPYASEYDRRRMNNGWFDSHMPDLNQQNPLLATYLVQNSLWWIEYAGIDGIRMDTYPYPDPAFMSRWCGAVLAEYPQFGIVGEVWVDSQPITGYWLAGTTNRDGYVSQLPSTTDFPVYFAVPKALNEPAGWDTGLARLYNTLAQDFAYRNPAGHVIFLDNHDLGRFYYEVGKDLNKFKMGLAFLLTTRGVPQLYYGTEILFDRSGSSHPDVRLDFPGGWPGDPVNAFTAAGRTAGQNAAFDYIRTLANWRKGKKVIHTGKLMQFVPEDNVYVYFRYDDREAVMVVMNGNAEAKTIQTARYAERLKGYTRAKDVATGTALPQLDKITIPARTALVLELER